MEKRSNIIDLVECGECDPDEVWNVYQEWSEDAQERFDARLLSRLLALKGEAWSDVRCRRVGECYAYISQKRTQVPDVRESEANKVASTKNFRNIVQFPDKDKLLTRLHELIDGKAGADVGAVLLHAAQKNFLTRCPTRAEYESEFALIGSWSAIRNYLNENNGNALYKAKRIVIFEE